MRSHRPKLALFLAAILPLIPLLACNCWAEQGGGGGEHASVHDCCGDRVMDPVHSSSGPEEGCCERCRMEPLTYFSADRGLKAERPVVRTVSLTFDEASQRFSPPHPYAVWISDRDDIVFLPSLFYIPHSPRAPPLV